MAARLNTRFLLLLVTVLGALGIIGGGLTLYVLRTSATRNLERGHALMAEGDYEGAFEEYGRAISKDGTNLEYLALAEEALLKFRPPTDQRAQEMYQQYLSLLAHRARLQLNNEDAQAALLEELYRNARLTNVLSYWTMLETTAEDCIQRMPESARIRFYHAVARDRRREALTLTPEEVQAIDRDLRAYLEAKPEDDRGWAALAYSLFTRADRARVAGSVTEWERYVREGDAVLAEALATHPDSLELAILNTRRLSSRASKPNSDVTRTDVEAAAEKMVSLVGDDPDVALLGQVASVLPSVQGRRGLDRAIELFEGYLAAHPEATFARSLYASLLLDAGRLDEAYAEAERVATSEPLPTSFLAQVRFSRQRRAVKQMFDVEYARYAQAEDEAAGDAALDRARAQRDRLATMVADAEEDPLVSACDAWLAMAAEDFSEAVAEFEHVIADDPEGADVRTYLGAAAALERRNEPGLARERLRAALEANPGHLRATTELARLNVRLGDYAEAETLAREVLVAEPENEEARRWLGEALAAQGKVDENSGPMAELVALVRRANDAMERGDFETARTILTGLIERHPDREMLRFGLAELEAAAGRHEVALGLIEELLAQYPDHPGAERLTILRDRLQGGDPVAILEQRIAAQASGDLERALGMVLGLRDLAREQREKAARAATQGDAAAAEEARAKVAEYERLEDEHAAKAIAAAPEHPDVLRLRLQRAIEAQDWKEGEAVVLTAEAVNADGANGRLFRGQLAMARNRPAEAAVALLEASKIMPYSSDVWALLGRAYQAVGNVTDAVTAYEEAFKRRPNDPQIIRSLVTVLTETGQAEEALGLLRESRSVEDQDPALREARLTLERQTGDPYSALAERRTIYRRDPSDRTNALRLATLLAELTPSPQSIVDPRTGQARYSPQAWARLSEADRQRVMEREREAWTQEAMSIFDAIEAKTGRDLELAAAKATFYREIGNVIEGERVLAELVTAQDPPSVDAMMRLADYQASLGQTARAEATLRAALPYQDDATRAVDRALASICFDAGKYETARDHFRRVTEVRPEDRVAAARLVESHLRLRDFDAAERDLEALMARSGESGRTVEMLLLSSSIARGRGEDALAQGDAVKADGFFGRELELIDEAVRLNPDSPVPLMARANAKYRAYGRTRNSVLLDEALLDLGVATQMRVDYFPAYRLRSEIHLAKQPPDVARAANELRTIVSMAPREWDARRALIELLLRTGETAQAIQVTQETIQLNPATPVWHELLGDLHQSAGQTSAALASYENALRVGGAQGVVAKMARAYLAMRPPRYEEVVRLLESTVKPETMNAVMRCYYGRSLAHLPGRRDRGLQVLRDVYGEYRGYVERTGNAYVLDEWLVAVGSSFADRPAEEVEAFVLGLAGDPPSVHLLRGLAELWIERGEAGRPRGVELLNQVAERVGEEPDALRRADLYARLGLAYSAAGRSDDAVRMYERALEDAPNNPLVLNNLAHGYATAGQPEKALPLARRALERMPDSATVLDTVGNIERLLGNHEEAERLLRRSLLLEPNADNNLHLALLLRERGRDREAAPLLRDALRHDPDAATRAQIERQLADIGG